MSYTNQTLLIPFCKTIKNTKLQAHNFQSSGKDCPQKTAESYPFSCSISHVASCCNPMSLKGGKVLDVIFVFCCNGPIKSCKWYPKLLVYVSLSKEFLTFC